MKIYCDLAAIIYFVQRVAPWFATVQARLAIATVSPVVSDLNRLECLVKPQRTGNSVLAAEFATFFARCDDAPLLRNVFERAAEIRAIHRFRTVDSIHLAAAVLSACDVFLTNDRQLAIFPDIKVEILRGRRS